MSITTLATTSNITHQIKHHLAKNIYESSLKHLQKLVDAYGHTGNEYYWHKAKKQHEICDKLYLLIL